jgi:histidine triad (HIT) family protein
MSSIFTKIIKGEIPCYKIAEDEDHLAFLDIQPLAKGHVLVIPKKETDYYFDLTDKEFFALNAFAKKVAIALKKGMSCKKIGMSVIGLEVPHAHIHLVPINDVGDMNFSKTRLHFTDEEYKTIATLISEHL